MRQARRRVVSGVAQTPRPDRSRFGWLAFFGALALLFGWYTWSQLDEYRALSARGRTVEALVVGYETVHGRRSTTHYPVFRFIADGQTVQTASHVSADPAELRRGQRTKVIYDPADPTRVRDAASVVAGAGITPWVTGFLTLLMLALGALFLLPPRAKAAG